MVNYKTLSDFDLITLIKDGDHDAYTEVYIRHHRLLITFALKRLNDSELTKDLVQDVFAGLWMKRSTLTEIKNLPAYLITLIKNKILNVMGHEKVKSKYASSLADYATNHYIADTDYTIREKQLKTHIGQLVEQLPAKMRQSFVLSRFQYYSNKEISKDLNTTEGNVSKHVHSAIRILKTKLNCLFF